MSAMDEIYQKYAQTVYKYLMSRTHDMNLSEELTQETFFQAVRSIGKYDGSCHITTWLCAIASNVLQTYRRKHPPEAGLTELDHTDVSVSDTFMQTEERVSLLKKLHALQEPYREVMYLRIFCDLSFNEIGEIYGKSENWARVTYYRGREKLRKDVENDA